MCTSAVRRWLLFTVVRIITGEQAAHCWYFACSIMKLLNLTNERYESMKRIFRHFNQICLSILLAAALPTWVSANVVQPSSCESLFDLHVVSLTATAQIGIATNNDSGVKFPVQIVRYQSGNNIGYLHTLSPTDIPKSAQLNLTIVNEKGDTVKVDLPANMDQKIIGYLRAGAPPTAPFDCNCFAHYMNGVEYVFGRFDYRQWAVRPLAQESLLKPGNTLIIGHNSSTLTHFALYLGHGLYLSKFGASGPLIVTDLEAMKIGFGGNEVFVADHIVQ